MGSSDVQLDPSDRPLGTRLQPGLGYLYRATSKEFTGQ